MKNVPSSRFRVRLRSSEFEAPSSRLHAESSDSSTGNLARGTWHVELLFSGLLHERTEEGELL